MFTDKRADELNLSSVFDSCSEKKIYSLNRAKYLFLKVDLFQLLHIIINVDIDDATSDSRTTTRDELSTYSVFAWQLSSVS